MRSRPKTFAIAIFHGLGDCINATTLLKPIKHSYPASRITWISSEKYIPIVSNNPLIHKREIVRVPDPDKQYSFYRRKYIISFIF